MEFFFTGIRKKFEDAESFCAGKGGKLYEPKDANMMQDVSNQAAAGGIGKSNF